ncbi:uncharacterized protein LOC114416154 [Glycine soja]|uniref:uncharacterized protein LOC114416154 n=1 Tax=Glycine soja TaxID=3848 RepID=UPI00103A85B3|nr:uncharacterized protein LOC114416154 [Glycine soja]
MAASDHTILRDRAYIPTKRRLLELSSQDELLAQNKLLSKQLEALTETLSKLPTQLHSGQPSPSSVLQVAGCLICGGAHESGYYISQEEATREVNYMGNQPRPNFNAGGHSGFQYGQQYHSQQGQWRNHPRNQFNKDQGGPSNRPQQQGPSLYDRTTKLEETFTQFMQVSKSNQKGTESAIKNLEVQVGQLAKQLADRPSSSFGANTEKNPNGECKVVMTRSRLVAMKEGENGIGAEKQQLVSSPALDPVVESLSGSDEELEAEDEKKKETTINLNMLTKKNKYIHNDTIVVEGNCSAIIQCILPLKHKDPGSVTIPCSIGEVSVGKALIDLGASINLMSLSMCWRLGELEIMPTRMTLQLADRSVTRPYGVIEDVLVRVKHLIFPTDFVVMDIEEDADIPVILGRPFMSTASCVVDMGKKKLEISLENQQISFDLFNEGRELLDQDACLQVKELDKKVLKERTKIDPG